MNDQNTDSTELPKLLEDFDLSQSLMLTQRLHHSRSLQTIILKLESNLREVVGWAYNHPRDGVCLLESHLNYRLLNLR